MSFAHSPKPEKGVETQEYAAHIMGVLSRAEISADTAH
ncbi:MAG: hypothetical protein Ta2G_18740 [Termitinemataceae bacterium]|nr:MAG: hypothetical protein Ta2G_18740 [Termitinemataceae bacterium]